MSAPACPFARALYPPGHPKHSEPGPDVLALKRGLWRAGFFEGPASKFDEAYNQKAATAVRAFQRQAGIQPTGNVGFATWEALRHTRRKDHPDDWAFDTTACNLAAKAAAALSETPREKAQRLGVDAAYYWVLHRAEVAYAQVRPMHLVKPPTIPPIMDCSWYTTTVFWAADAPDPNGRGYSEPVQGYTGTQVVTGYQVPASDAEPLDLAFYGFTTHPTPAFPYGSPTHVAVCVGGGYVASHGSDSGPEKRDLDYRPLHSVRRYPLA